MHKLWKLHDLDFRSGSANIFESKLVCIGVHTHAAILDESSVILSVVEIVDKWSDTEICQDAAYCYVFSSFDFWLKISSEERTDPVLGEH